MQSSPRKQRKVLNGTVSSRMGDKSVKVTVPYKARHPRYLKVTNRKTVLHVHDEENTAQVGDRVQIMETRPLSRLKRWRICQVLERAPQAFSVVADPVEATGASTSGQSDKE
ncbi:30S ribosomal protein S17 [Opitutales bacterium ASA1]|uniref:30S ribosomal protein S17 n=1 Tax=Congregicoccus parvus TaxID=3081749 RepID=UPI002B2944B8|nr:30S ribosomal protein S17 [Opitutales bacterium ASA1]